MIDMLQENTVENQTTVKFHLQETCFLTLDSDYDVFYFHCPIAFSTPFPEKPGLNFLRKGH